MRHVRTLVCLVVTGMVGSWLSSVCGCGARDDRGSGWPSYDAGGWGGPDVPPAGVDAGWSGRGLDPACWHGAGAGPAEARPSWRQGRFPLEPFLELYAQTQCRTLSPSFVRDLVEDLPGYLATGEGDALEAPPGAFAAAAVELTGFDETTLRWLLGVGPDDDLDAALAELLRLYVGREDGAEGTAAWQAYGDDHPYVGAMESSVGQLLYGLWLGWGSAPLAAALGVEEAVVAAAMQEQEDALYREVLGVDRETALTMLADAGLSQSDTLGSFVSIVHVGGVENGLRSAYVFVADRDVAPIRGLQGADFDVFEAGAGVPKAGIEARTLDDLVDEERPGAEIALSFVLDYSASMSETDRAFLEEGLHYFLDVLPPVFRGGVIKFSTDAAVVQPMTADREALHRAIDAPMTPFDTALYDALRRGLEQLAADPAPLRLQLAFTDGMENASRHDCHDSVVVRSRELGAPVFVVGMGDIDVPAMFTLTNATNACFLYAPSSDSIRAIYELAGHFIGGTYILRWPAVSAAVAPPVTIVVHTPEGDFHDDFDPAGGR